MAVNPTKKSPYHGMAVFFIVDILASILVFAIINSVIKKGAGMSINREDLVFWQAFTFGIGVGFLLTLGVFIAGGLEEPFAAVKDRVICFVQDCKISFKEGLKWWWYRVKTEGIAFWVLITFSLLQALLLIWSITNFVRLYGA